MLKKFFNAKRTRNNDIVFFSGNVVSVHNIMLVLSFIMLIACFLAFVRLDVKILLNENYTNYSELRRIPIFSPINLVFNENIIYYMLGEGGIENVSTLNGVSILLHSFSWFFIVPIIIILTYFINRKLVRNIKISYKILMLQYALVLIGVSINYILLRFLAEVIKLDTIIPSLGNTKGAFKLTFFASLYSSFNTIILLLSLYGIVHTGTKEISEEIISTNVFSKEAVQKTTEFAKDLSQNVAQNMEVVTSVATKVVNDVKNTANTKFDEVKDSIKDMVEETKEDKEEIEKNVEEKRITTENDDVENKE